MAVDKKRIMKVLKAFGKQEFGVQVPSDWDEIESIVLSGDEMQDFSTNKQVLEEGGMVFTYVADDLPEWDDVSLNINVVTTNDGIPVDVSMDTEEGNTHLDYDASRYIEGVE
jgi:hypothetical protein